MHAYKEAETLIEYAAKLDTIEYAFELSEKGHFQIDVDTRNSRIKFQYADSKADKADTPLRAREIEMVLSGERGRPDERLTQAITRVYDVLRPSVLVTGHERCTYKYSNALFDALHEYSAVRVQTVPEEMDATVLVDGFSFGELRSIWGALLALSDGHMMAHWIAVRDMKVKFPGRTMVFHKPRKQLEGLISQISHLSPETVRELLSLHLYDPHLAYMGPVLQPLLPLNSSEVCLPTKNQSQSGV